MVSRRLLCIVCRRAEGSALETGQGLPVWQHAQNCEFCMYFTPLGLGFLICKWKRIEMTFMDTYYFL